MGCPCLATSDLVSNTHQQLELDPEDLDIPIALRKRTQACTKHPLHLFFTYSNPSLTHKAFLTNINSIPIPRTVFEALSHDSWNDAMKVEMATLEKNKT